MIPYVPNCSSNWGGIYTLCFDRSIVLPPHTFQGDGLHDIMNGVNVFHDIGEPTSQTLDSGIGIALTLMSAQIMESLCGTPR